MFEEMLKFIQKFISETGGLTEILLTEINFGFFKFSILSLVTISGLMAYLTVAVVKWIK